jgi:fructose 1,6-bisphosphate aldolase/phosphatase
MKITVTAIKADVGSIGGHITPGKRLLETVTKFVAQSGVPLDFKTFFTGDDIAILMTHRRGADDQAVHRLAWDAFKEASHVAAEMGLYGAGQDLLKTAFSGNVKGAGPAVAEMEFEERENEPFVLFMADKTDPGAYNLPLFLGFADPMYSAGLLLSTGLGRGFRFIVQDVDYIKGDRLIELNAPEDYYDLATLLRDLERYVIKEIYSRQTGEQAAAVCTTRLHNIAGKYTGKDKHADFLF